MGPSGLGRATFDVVVWQRELATVCAVPVPSTTPPPSSDLAVPWVLVGTGAALDGHRPDLYDVLVARADGSVTIEGRPLDLVSTREQVRSLHLGVLGRLRCTGTVPASRRVGWVSRVLYADGWRALTPYSSALDGRRAMVRLEPRSPGDLAHDVARWAVTR